MIFNKNQVNNTNKAQKTKQMSSSGSIINKKMGKERNFIIDRTSSNILEQGTDFSAIEYTYSRRTPKPDIINEILKRLEKIDLKLDNIELVQKAQGEEIKEIKEVQRLQGEEIQKLNTKLNAIIVLNNLKME